MSRVFQSVFGLLYALSSPVSITLSVVAKAHSCLAEANGVFASTDTIVLLEFCLVNALWHTSAYALPMGASRGEGMLHCTHLTGKV